MFDEFKLFSVSDKSQKHQEDRQETQENLARMLPTTHRSGQCLPLYVPSFVLQEKTQKTVEKRIRFQNIVENLRKTLEKLIETSEKHQIFVAIFLQFSPSEAGILEIRCQLQKTSAKRQTTLEKPQKHFRKSQKTTEKFSFYQSRTARQRVNEGIDIGRSSQSTVSCVKRDQPVIMIP